MSVRTQKLTKIQRPVIESDSEVDDLTPVKRGKNGEELAPCGRPSFSANAVNKKYNSRYRNELNQNRLGGKVLDLGKGSKASGIVAFVLFGFDVSLEAAHSADHIRIFKSAAWYALNDEEIEEIFQHSEAEVDFYIKGLVTAGIRLWKYEAPEEVKDLIVLICFMILSNPMMIFCAFLQAKKLFQSEVFAQLVENPLFQEHLALAPGQRVQSQ